MMELWSLKFELQVAVQGDMYCEENLSGSPVASVIPKLQIKLKKKKTFKSVKAYMKSDIPQEMAEIF